MNIVLWMIQILLAALFVFAGSMKFVTPVEEMTRQMPSMPGAFLHFIGACEILGGLGLVLPRLFGIAVRLTPLAASLLVIIMIGAVATTLPAATAALPAVVGILCAFVAWGRWRLVR
jgi:hypothetical protein